MVHRDKKTGEFLNQISDWKEDSVAGFMAWFRTKRNAVISMCADDVEILEYGGHELGKAYYIDYWQQYALVTHLGDDKFGWRVTYRWDDGRVGSHFTSLGHKDREVSLEEYEAVCEVKRSRKESRCHTSR